MTKPAQSSSFSCRWSYDVFISFRGEDTRLTFTGNLYNALNQRGIRTFIDDQELKRGEEITPSLFKAIEESRMAIIIFSENYASSTFCLDELVHILKYLKGKGRLVWPVFYDVDPSQVRHQKESYGKALARHEERFKDSRDKVQKWRLALSEAANLSGWQLKQGNEYEYKFIGRIIEEISIKINRIPLYVTDCPVGLESRVQEVNSLLDVGSNSGVNMVGICGIGGIGKTTIARAVYNLIGDQFEGLCFLSNVREVSDKHGLSHLQETLLTKILGENIKLGDDNEGVSIIKQRLCQKRVLLILDDVDKRKQLETIAGRCDWFGCGSRIIITTRDKHLLASHEVERIYDVEKLDHEEAIQLLSWKAFRKVEIHSSYVGISGRVVDYCSGLPLALEVIGSNFYGKRIDEWDSALHEYERIPDSEILKVLKLTYDALEDNEKEIFLDVACFFKGDTFEDVKNRLLSVRDIKPEYALGVLIAKSLIKIEYGCVRMHDLIEDMGREIIRQESPKEPGGRSRLWFYQDILHVLQENTGTDKIEVIIVDLPGSKEVNWSGKAFKKMKNLRMLSIRNASFSRGPEHLPNSLRVLDWRHYPWKFLPFDFHPTNLVNLNLSNSSCVLLEPLTKKLDCLTDMNLSYCEFLKQVPDLSGVPNLRKLCLNHCSSLTEIHDSIGFLGELRELHAVGCTNLRTFPRHIKLPFLECLKLSRCSSLQCFPEVLEEMGYIINLDLSRTAIEELPYSIRNLTGLQTLELEECKFLRQLPDLYGVPNLRWLRLNDCPSITEIHVSIGFLGELRLLSAERCTNLKTFPRCIKLPFRECLELSQCSSLQCFPEELKEMGNLPLLNLSWTAIEELPYSIRNLTGLRRLCLKECKFLRQVSDLSGVPNLQELYLDGCSSLTEIHDSVGFLGELRVLSAECCTNLKTFPRRIKLPFCEYLELSRCSSLQCFPEVLEEMKNIIKLDLSGTAIEELPYSIRNLTGLEILELKECKFLRQLPDLSGVPNLQLLRLDGCPSLTEIHDSVGFLGELRVLSAERCTNLKTFPRRIKLPFCNYLELSRCSNLQCFPEVLEEMKNIRKLDLSGTAIEELPYSIRNLTGLEILELKECKFLRQLPDLSGVPNLRWLRLDGCPSLTEIHVSIGFLGELRLLSASSCTNLKTFPRCIKLPFCECLDLSRCSSLQCFPEVLEEMKNIRKLDLSGTAIEELPYSICDLIQLQALDLSSNSFTILPAWIEHCYLLRNLIVKSCKQLRQIEGMPPNLTMFIAENCTSLTSPSSSKILNQVFQLLEKRYFMWSWGMKFIFPGQEVPKWFDHYSNGESVSFWVRKEFPPIAVCVVVGVLDNRDSSSINVSLSMRINGTDEEFECNQMTSTLETDHICLFDLKVLFLDSKFMELVEQDKWYHIEVLCKSEPFTFESEVVERGGVKCCGVYVYKQLTRMENIQFSRPSSPKRTCHELYNSINDLKLGCSPLMKKQHTSLDMGDCDCESLDIQHQRCLALVPTVCETVSKHKGKDLSMYNEGNEGSEWLSMRPCGQETLAFMNWDSNSMKSASTSDTIGDQGFERGAVKCCEVHVYKELNSMENIQFSRPSSSKRTYHELYNSNNDLKLGCSPLMKKQHTSLDVGDCDCESRDIQHQRCLALVATGCETVSKHKGKDLSMYNEGNEGSEWLSMRPCGQETLAFMNWNSNSMKSASTSDTISDQDVIVLDHLGPAKSQRESLSSNIGGKLHQTTSSTALPTTTDGSSRNRIEPTPDDI